VTQTLPWSRLKPLFDAMFFDLGPREIERRTGLGMRTLYCLLEGKTKEPRARTLRDLQSAILEWRPESCEMEHTPE
jgi:predicted transcriptional regulator